jgi:hypothetical protein
MGLWTMDRCFGESVDRCDGNAGRQFRVGATELDSSRVNW